MTFQAKIFHCFIRNAAWEKKLHGIVLIKFLSATALWKIEQQHLLCRIESTTSLAHGD